MSLKNADLGFNFSSDFVKMANEEDLGHRIGLEIQHRHGILYNSSASQNWQTHGFR